MAWPPGTHQDVQDEVTRLRAALADPSSLPGYEIDTAESAITMEVLPVGTVQTDVPGLYIVVPPQSRPYEVSATFYVSFISGTAAANTVQGVIVVLVDATDPAAPLNVAANGASQVQVAAATRTANHSVTVRRRFPPSTVTAVYKMQARLGQAAVAGWSNVQLLAGDLPAAGEFFGPMSLTARTV